MGLISRAWTNLAPPGAMSPPIDLTRPPVSVEQFHDVAEDDSLGVNRIVGCRLKSPGRRWHLLPDLSGLIVRLSRR
jgi:hypothetical protein